VAPDAAAAKAWRAVTEGLTTSVNGKDVKVVADSVCVHSDTLGAMEVAKAVHGALRHML
jgi:5-oxoprolinase (ATP-hydrolysing) subunit A